LLIAQIVPLAILAVTLAGVGAMVANRVVERTSDQLLAGSVTAILQQVGAENGRATVVFSPWALGLLDGPERDAVFYSVHQGRVLITGYGDLTTASPPAPNELALRYGRMKGMPVRIAEAAILVPGVREPVVVAVAQTLDSRKANTRDLLRGLIGLPVALVLAAALLLWPAILWGLSPVRRLVRRLTDQSASRRADYTPVSLDRVPRELSPVVTAFNGLLGNLEASASALERFAADASHQLRTPLSVITANLALLAAPGRRKAEQTVLVQDSRDAASRLHLVLRQLLALARAEAAVSSGHADLVAVISAVVNDTASAFPDAVVRIRAPRARVPARGDAILIGEMLANLLRNAIQYGDGAVVIRLDPRGGNGAPTIVLWDHGEGLPETELPRLTERFYRGRASQGTAGAGLGLAIVRSIADAMDVEVRISSRVRRPGLIVRLVFRASP
jgi:two-component system sensor histidine kinase TctE